MKFKLAFLCLIIAIPSCQFTASAAIMSGTTIYEEADKISKEEKNKKFQNN